MKKLTICVDFDETLFHDEFPDVGPPLPGAIEALNKLYDQGHTLLIWTCREGEEAENAILALEREGAKYHRFNHNDPERIARYGYDSRKLGCDILIDDKCVYSYAIGIRWDEILGIIEELADYED
jgi:hypothetical protein